MKSSLTRTMIAVAALAVAAGSASAQTLNAKIPMAFRAGKKAMAAGDYTVHIKTGSAVPIVQVSNVNEKESALLIPAPGGDVPKAWLNDGTPKMTFACAADRCVLTQLWNGEGSSTLRFQHRELPNIQARGVTMVTLAMVKVH